MDINNLISILSNEEELANKLIDNPETVFSTTLNTDERVIARVTDGIYRQPGSALRELISNAYDADATRVIIKTDAPRFETMSIEDNGHGMSPKALAYVMHHIGGSSKRNELGAHLGVTNPSSHDLSPKGRHLIGKIGIGLFSVAQLTQSFQIITKRRGDKYRTIATIALKQFSEKSVKDNEKLVFESGKVNIWIEKAEDINNQGTTIILNKIRPQTRETLSSSRIWEAVASSRNEAAENGATPINPPLYHIGIATNKEFYDELGGKNGNNLPWESSDDPSVAFDKLVRSVWNQLSASNPKPKLEDIFDYYLNMVWALALSIPAKYTEGDIFDMPFGNDFYPYMISNLPKGQARAIEINVGEKLGSYLLSYQPNNDNFDVYIDDLKLSRPIIFKELPNVSKHAIDKPMVFIGECEENFGERSHDISGGKLKFRAYLFWNSKIAPVEHQGVLIRVHGASGTGFDMSLMKYQVQETTRRSQLTCEIFVSEGLDSALNIDRESYNFSHPHVVYLTRWLHSAIRQFANAHKAFGKKIRDEGKVSKSTTLQSNIHDIAQKAWVKAGNDIYQDLPIVEIKDDDTISKNDVLADYSIDFSKVTDLFTKDKSNLSKRKEVRKSLTEEKLKAITIVLASYGALDNVPREKINEMIYSIYEIISTEE